MDELEDELVDTIAYNRWRTRSLVSRLDAVMARHHYAADALIEVLHAAQQLYGYLAPDILRQIAHKLKLPPSRVLGAATFYHLFRFTPNKPHSASVCLGTACYVAGASELTRVFRKHPDWTLITERCIGSCGVAPLVICDGVTLARTTPDAIESHLRNALESDLASHPNGQRP